MFPYSYYAPNNLFYSPRRVERPEPAEDPYWSLERVAALRAAELQRKEQQKAELKQQYEQRLAQIDEYHNQQELELSRFEAHIKKLQEQKSLQEKRILEQQKQKAEARKRNEELINSLFKNYETKKQPATTETKSNAASNPPSSPFELLLSLLNGTDLNGSSAAASSANSKSQSEAPAKPHVESKLVSQDPELATLAAESNTSSEPLDGITPTSTASEAAPESVPEPVPVSASEVTEPTPEPKTEKKPEVNMNEILRSISDKIDKNIETYDRIHTHTIDGNEEDGEPYSSLSTSSDSQSSSITLRSRLKVLQRSQLELENIYQQLDTLGTPADKTEKRLKHVLTGRAVTYADKLEELRHRIHKDLAKLNQENQKQQTKEAEVPKPVDELTSTPAEAVSEKSQQPEATEPADTEENTEAATEPEDQVNKKPETVSKPVLKEKNRVRRIEIQDLSDDEDF